MKNCTIPVLVKNKLTAMPYDEFIEDLKFQEERDRKEQAILETEQFNYYQNQMKGASYAMHRM